MDRTTPGWLRALRLAFALLIVAAIGSQLIYSSANPNFNPFNFFSFFTNQSNIIAAVVLAWGALMDPRPHPTPVRNLVRGAAVLYMSVTGVVYGLLLSDLQEQLQLSLPWVDTVLHKIIPLVMVIDWLIAPPRGPVTFRQALVWLAFPVVWLIYTLARGPVVGWYPYPFLDPDNVGGYQIVALYCLAITFGALVFIWLVVLTGRRLRLVTVPAEAQLERGM